MLANNNNGALRGEEFRIQQVKGRYRWQTGHGKPIFQCFAPANHLPLFIYLLRSYFLLFARKNGRWITRRPNAVASNSRRGANKNESFVFSLGHFIARSSPIVSLVKSFFWLLTILSSPRSIFAEQFQTRRQQKRQSFRLHFLFSRICEMILQQFAILLCQRASKMLSLQRRHSLMSMLGVSLATNASLLFRNSCYVIAFFSLLVGKGSWNGNCDEEEVP